MGDRIFGHSWEAIQRAQNGGRLHDRIDTSKPIVKPQATDGDRALLVEHGLNGLEAMQFHGVIGRLRDSGLI